MTEEVKSAQELAAHVEEVRKQVYDKDGDKPFVFVSYRSADREEVFGDVVHRLVSDWGLHVYFDASFDNHNPHWTSQFPENMESHKCLGLLIFVSNAYIRSHATLLELMYSQTIRACNGKEKQSILEGLPVVRVDLEDYTQPMREEAEVPTGLGIKKQGDKVNESWQATKDLFTETFEELAERGILSKFLYKPQRVFKRSDCFNLFTRLLGCLRINKNPYKPGQNLSGIVGTIIDAMGEDVFDAEKLAARLHGGEKVPTEDTGGGEKTDRKDVGTVEPVKSGEAWAPDERLTLPEFFKRYKSNTEFTAKSFSAIRLVGNAEFAKYSTEICDSTYPLLYALLEQLIAERGASYIEHVNKFNKSRTNKVFLTEGEFQAYKEQCKKQQKREYRYYKLNTNPPYRVFAHVSVYDAVRELSSRLSEVAFPQDQFVLELKKDGVTKHEVQKLRDGKSDRTAAIPDKTQDTPEKPAPIPTDAGNLYRLSFSEFLRHYKEGAGVEETRKFQKDTFLTIRLVGRDEYERFGSDAAYTTTAKLNKDFVLKMLEEKGEDYVRLVREKNKDNKTQVFYTPAEHEAYLEERRRENKKPLQYELLKTQPPYRFNTNFSPYGHVKELRKRVEELGFPEDAFVLELVLPTGSQLPPSFSGRKSGVTVTALSNGEAIVDSGI